MKLNYDDILSLEQHVIVIGSNLEVVSGSLSYTFPRNKLREIKLINY
jgi:hypothetical protein